jgi:hypothetical protein
MFIDTIIRIIDQLYECQDRFFLLHENKCMEVNCLMRETIVLLFKVKMLIAKIVDSKVKPLYRFGVKERTDQFFNIYRLKKKGGFFGSLFFLRKKSPSWHSISNT